MSDLVLILLGTVLVNDFALTGWTAAAAQERARGYSRAEYALALANLLALSIAAPMGYALQRYLLAPEGWMYLRTPAFLLFSGFIALAWRQASARLQPDPEHFASRVASANVLQLVTINGAVLGLALLSAQRMQSLWDAVLLGVGSGAAFAYSLVTFRALRARVAAADVPRIFRDAPVTLITAGVAALALLGFAGLIKI